MYPVTFLVYLVVLYPRPRMSRTSYDPGVRDQCACAVDAAWRGAVKKTEQKDSEKLEKKIQRHPQNW